MVTKNRNFGTNFGTNIFPLKDIANSEVLDKIFISDVKSELSGVKVSVD